VNVLEHIEDDAEFLRQLAEHLRPGGRLLIFVPAFETLYSDFDRAIGHHRRYRLSTMATTVDKAGLEVADVRYVNSVGAVAWWMMVKQLRQTPARTAAVKLYDRAIVPALRRREARRPPKFGQSVFCVARKPDVDGD
jgi:SAM-dependent methyltransferase